MTTPAGPQYARTEERARVLDRHPDYTVAIDAAPGTWRAHVDGTVIAHSARALEVRESFHEDVVYFPMEDVETSLLERSAHSTRCPFKGDASYYDVVLDGRRLENAVWVYETPMQEVAALGGCLAFYADRVDVEAAD